MKIMMLGLMMMMGVAGTALAIEPAQLDKRIRELTAKFELLQGRPDKGIPADVLRRAQGIILLDRTKAGFLFAYEGGGGIGMVRDPNSGAWSPAAFLGASDASLGFQIGGEKDFYAILLMSRDAERALTDPNYKFGGEARGTAGDVSAGHQGKITTLDQPVIIYDNRKGLYGGAAIQGGSISPDNKANRIYYDHYVSMRDILFDHKVQASEAASDLGKILDKYCGAPASTVPDATAPVATAPAPPPPIERTAPPAPAAPVDAAPVPPAPAPPPPDRNAPLPAPPETNAPQERIPVTDAPPPPPK